VTPMTHGTHGRVMRTGGTQEHMDPLEGTDPGPMDTPTTVLEGRVELLDGSAERQSLRSTPPATPSGERSPVRAGASGQGYGSSMARLGNRFSAKRIVSNVRTSYPHVARPFAVPARLRQRSEGARERAAFPIRLRCSRPRLPVTAQIRRGWAR
jgi:hypothetical protein